jgi:hypothetical protein
VSVVADTFTLPRHGEPVEDVKKADDTDLRCWGTTTIIGVLDKPALVYWAANETAHAAVQNVNAWKAIEQSDGTEEAEKWIAGARFRGGKGQLTAAALGTSVHAACEEFVLNGMRPDDEQLGKIVAANGKLTAANVTAEVGVINTMLDRFSDWLDKFQPVYQATEVTVFHPDYAYAGTSDGFFTVDGMRLIFDIKTTREPRDKQGNLKAPYPEVALQLASYRHAALAAVWRPRRVMEFRRRYYVLSQSERDLAVPVPEVDGGAVVHITPEGCELFPVRCDEQVFERFLHVIEVARWKFEMEATVIGAPLAPPIREDS